MSTEEKRPKYNREFKLEAVRLSHEPGRSVSGVARNLGISANVLHRWRRHSIHPYPVAPNLLDRQFTVDRPNALWVSDITYIRTSEG